MTWFQEHAVFLAHWDDLISDFSAIHRVHVPLERLPVCWLWPMAERLSAYTGVLRARAESEQQGGRQGTPGRSGSGRAPSPPGRASAGHGRHVQPVQDFRPDDPLLKGFVETSHHQPRRKKGA